MKQSSLFDLTGQTALVTGCRRGIGLSMAQALASAGADIIGVSASMEADGGEVGKLVRGHGTKFTAYQADFSNRKATHAFVAKVIEDFPVIDILVNNAGSIQRAPAAEHSDEIWDEVLEINLNSQFVISREIGKRMVERGRGKIIFTASLLTFQGGVTVPGYAASKGGVGQLTKALANEWAGRGVNVNAIAPGYVVTDVTTALRGDPVRCKQILDRIPAGRWGEPDDFAGPVLFLASDASRYVHGTILTVDGGWMGR